MKLLKNLALFVSTLLALSSCSYNSMKFTNYCESIKDYSVSFCLVEFKDEESNGTVLTNSIDDQNIIYEFLTGFTSVREQGIIRSSINAYPSHVGLIQSVSNKNGYSLIIYFEFCKICIQKRSKNSSVAKNYVCSFDELSGLYFYFLSNNSLLEG